MPTRHAKAEWQGDLRSGKGTVEVESGAFSGRYSFGSRFESATGTNPEELVGAAEAGCFSMAFSGVLTEAGFPPEDIETSAAVTVEKQGDGFTITKIDLVTDAVVPGIDAETFRKSAESAKAGCPMSKALTGVTITLKANLHD